jgi:DHA1 family multidrug resistance protein-like MFS transporter
MKIFGKDGLITLYLVIFIDSLSYFIIIPVLLRLISQDGVGPFAQMDEALRGVLFGITLGLLKISYLLFAPFIGFLSDRIGRKKVLAGCLGFAAAGFAATIAGINSQSLVLILAGRFIGGIGASSQPVAFAAIADRCVGEEKAKYLSLAAIAMTLAMLLGPLLGAYFSNPAIVGSFNNETPFLIAIIFVLINLLLLKRNFKENSQPKLIEPQSTTLRAWKAILNIKSNPVVICFFGSFFIYEFSWSLYFQDISLYLQQTYHYLPEQAAHFTTWAGVCMLFGLIMLYPYLLRYFSLPTIVTCGLITMAFSLFFPVAMKTVWAEWVSAASLAIAVGIIYPSLLALVSGRLSKEQQGFAMGLSATMLASAWALSAFLIGVLTSVFASLPLVTAACASVLSLAIFSYGRHGVEDIDPCQAAEKLLR